MTDNSPTPKDTKNFPPLGWIIIALVLAIGIVLVVGPQRFRTSPSGVATPAAGQPAEPATGKAPADPPG